MKKQTLQDRIKAIQDYFRGIEVKETLFILRVSLPYRWSAYNRDDEVIKVAKSDVPQANKTDAEWFYYADVNEVDLNEMFDLVEETIRTNEEVNQKIELMKVRMEELKDIFQNETLERLQTLEFTFAEPQKRKKKTKQKAKTEQAVTKKDIAEEVKTEEPQETNTTSDIINIDELEELEKQWS